MKEIQEIKEFSNQVRKHVLEMVYKSKASHVGGALSCADILSVLYNGILNVQPENPGWKDRDRFLFSKGHSCTSLYAALALKGFFPLEDLKTYSQDGSLLLSHVSHKIPGVELSTGSLGHALPVACGMALAAKRMNAIHRVFVLLGDGELDEGSNWEAFLFAPHHKLDNLVVIVDHNKIQSLGNVEDVLNLNCLEEKFRAFNWTVSRIDGHDHEAISNALNCLPMEEGKPYIIIADTVKGKGVDFMENKLLWHYKSPSITELDNALKQLENGKGQ